MQPITHISARNLRDLQIKEPAYTARFEYEMRDGTKHSAPGLTHPAILSFKVELTSLLHDVVRDAFQLGHRLTIEDMPGRMSVEGFVVELRPNFGGFMLDVVFKCTGAPKVNLETDYDRAMQEAKFFATRNAPMLRDDARRMFTLDPLLSQVTSAYARQAQEEHERALKMMLPPEHPMCRATLEELKGYGPDFVITDDPMKKEPPVKIRNKYYVASPSVTTAREQGQDNKAPAVSLATHHVGAESGGRWTRKDLADCITQATEQLEKNPGLEHVAIVRIVRVVRRKKQPVVVEVIA
jgi:hypothetical protein